MSFDKSWDIDKYKEEYESDDQWKLRRAFMEKWQSDYTEERLVSLAKVFANMEFLGCRYPTEIMQEVARLSNEIAQSYREIKKTKLQRTFISASEAAIDRAKGIKRKGGKIINLPKKKTAKIEFVKSVEKTENTEVATEQTAVLNNGNVEDDHVETQIKKKAEQWLGLNEYFEDLNKVKCLDLQTFREHMFQTAFGRLVLVIRPWKDKFSNIQASCQASKIQFETSYKNSEFCILLNGVILSQAKADTKLEAKAIAEGIAWNRLIEETVSVIVKEQWIPHGDAKINVSDVSAKRTDVPAKRTDVFGAPVEITVATKMMKMMGWKGGGLGPDAQGISEPITPNMQLIHRAGLGSKTADVANIRRAAQSLMQRFLASDTLDLDLVFSNDFSKAERAIMHNTAQKHGLASKSYGGNKERFLVVRKKLDPFSLVRAVIEKGGTTTKYQVFVPNALNKDNS